MTESEWLACTHPEPMLKFLQKQASDRKLRLFACGCSRRIWEAERAAAKVDDLHPALISAESLADGLVNVTEALNIRSQIGGAGPLSASGIAYAALCAALDKEADLAAECAAQHATNYFGFIEAESATFQSSVLRKLFAAGRSNVVHEEPSVWQSVMLRDIFGNPFHPVTIDPAWLTWNAGTIRKLAQTIYDERRFVDLPILADALEEAGCTSGDILEHCRGPGPHVRGCWVVDLILGKE